MSTQASAQAELGAFLGTWQLISAVSDGQAVPEAQIANVHVVISAGSHSVYIGDQVAAHDIAFTIDPTVTPYRTTDYLPDGRKIYGISRVEGDLLTSCVAPPDLDAPTQFVSTAGSGYTLRCFKRVNS